MVDSYENKDGLSKLLMSKVSTNILDRIEVDNTSTAKDRVFKSLQAQKLSTIMLHRKEDYFSKLIFYQVSAQSRFQRYVDFQHFADPSASDLEAWVVPHIPGAVTIVEFDQESSSFKQVVFSEEKHTIDYARIIDYFNEICRQRQ